MGPPRQMARGPSMPRHLPVNLNAARYAPNRQAGPQPASGGWPGSAQPRARRMARVLPLARRGASAGADGGSLSGAECQGHACGCMRRGPPGPHPRRNGGETKRGAHPAGNPSQAPRSLRALTEQGAGLQRALCREGKIEPRRERERESPSLARKATAHCGA
jgi:hypothetical protein